MSCLSYRNELIIIHFLRFHRKIENHIYTHFYPKRALKPMLSPISEPDFEPEKSVGN